MATTADPPVPTRPHPQHALIVGHTGIVGGNLAAHLLSLGGWKVTGVARDRSATLPGLTSVAVDPLDRTATLQALAGIAPTHLDYATWTRH